MAVRAEAHHRAHHCLHRARLPRPDYQYAPIV
jgi:hypothetical protein